ncbi:hypothetical protein ACA910_013581 [Epithemia clementina (nom. ined.)]
MAASSNADTTNAPMVGVNHNNNKGRSTWFTKTTGPSSSSSCVLPPSLASSASSVAVGASTSKTTTTTTTQGDQPRMARPPVSFRTNVARRKWPSPHFNVSQSTEDNYKLVPYDKASDHRELVLNTSRFAAIRHSLDYSYHSVYTIERQAFQDALIQSILDQHEHVLLSRNQQNNHNHNQAAPVVPESTRSEDHKQNAFLATPTTTTIRNDKKDIHDKDVHGKDKDKDVHGKDKDKGNNNTTTTPQWIVFTAGVMGAGKTYTLEWLHRQAYFPLHDYVVVDPDHIRRSLPEFHDYLRHEQQQRQLERHEQRQLERHHQHDTVTDDDDESSHSLAGEWTRQEANLVTEILTQAALQQGRSVVVDGTLRDATWYQVYFQQLRQTYSHLQLAILHITAPPKAVYQRAKNRAKVTGRVIPQALLQSVMEQVPASVQILRQQVDLFVELYNGPNTTPQLVTPPNLTWEQFTKLWNHHTERNKNHHQQHPPSAVASFHSENQPHHQQQQQQQDLSHNTSRSRL